MVRPPEAVYLQLQPGRRLCSGAIDKGPPETLLTVRGVAWWAPVDEVPQVLKRETDIEDELTANRMHGDRGTHADNFRKSTKYGRTCCVCI